MEAEEKEKVETRDAEGLVTGRPGETTPDAAMIPVGGGTFQVWRSL